MTKKFQAECEECGETLEYDDDDDREEAGWIEVYEGEDRCKDFCSRACVADHYYDGPLKEE